MLSYEAALALLVPKELLTKESLPIEKSFGRVLAEKVVSQECLPSFMNSAMDGFAFRIADFSGFEATFKIAGIVAAGETPRTNTPAGSAWEIMTGAPVPLDCDTVIKVEETLLEGDLVRFQRKPVRGEHIRSAGEDFRVGSLVVDSGIRLLPEHGLALSALGITSVSVYRQPKVSILSTGAELSANPEGGSGKIRNSTAPFLMAELNLLGAQPEFLGTNGDDPQAFLETLTKELEKNVDVVITTGAVSMGKYDFVATALRDLGAEIHFHKVAIRPGKPLLFATLGKTAFFGVPGNPVSTSVGLRFFVEPYLRRLHGVLPENKYQAHLSNSFSKPEGLHCFFKAAHSIEAGISRVHILKGQESFRIAPLLSANAWAILPQGVREVVENSLIEFVPLHSWAEKEINR